MSGALALRARAPERRQAVVAPIQDTAARIVAKESTTLASAGMGGRPQAPRRRDAHVSIVVGVGVGDEVVCACLPAALPDGLADFDEVLGSVAVEGTVSPKATCGTEPPVSTSLSHSSQSSPGAVD